MASVRASNSGDSGGMSRRLQPVVNSGPDFPSLDRHPAGPRVTGDQQDYAIPGGKRTIEAGIDGAPGSVERHAVEIDYAVRLDVAGAQPPVPGGIERLGGEPRPPGCRSGALGRAARCRLKRRCRFVRILSRCR